MGRRWLWSGVVVATLGTWGCSSWKLATAPDGAVAPTTPLPQAAARVCVVRTSLLAMAVTMPTHDNGMLVGATRGPTYFCYFAEPGEHEITIEADEIERVTFKAEAGRNYLLKQEVELNFGWVRCHAVWRPESEGEDLFSSSEHEILVGVPSDQHLPPLAILAPARAGRETVKY